MRSVAGADVAKIVSHIIGGRLRVEVFETLALAQVSGDGVLKFSDEDILKLLGEIGDAGHKTLVASMSASVFPPNKKNGGLDRVGDSNAQSSKVLKPREIMTFPEAVYKIDLEVDLPKEGSDRRKFADAIVQTKKTTISLKELDKIWTPMRRDLGSRTNTTQMIGGFVCSCFLKLL